MTIRLLLADDHPVVRAGLRAVLDTEADFTVVAEAATAERAVELAAAGGVDVVLMDLQFGSGMHGSEATAAITAAPGGPKVLVLTTYDTDADILAAVEAGASGYLLKDAPPGSRAAGSPTRQTMPCSWSVEISAGTGVGWASAACWMPLESSAICRGSRVLWAQEK